MAAKTESFRKKHLALRSAMTTEQVRRESAQIVMRLLASDWYRSAEEIFAYYPLKNEADCLPFLKVALLDGKKIALPRTRAGFAMDFFWIRSLSDVAEGRFHVMEPVADCKTAEPDGQIVLVPGVVFSRDGARYGYGKGYYDRFFARYPKLRRYGICFENQLEDSIPAGEHDVPMHRVYTGSCEIICIKENQWN